MSAEHNQRGIAGEAFKSGNPGIWDEIRYLDSETNYREYLPAAACPKESRDELIMTDDATASVWNTIVAVFLLMFMAVLFVVLLVRAFDL